MSKLINMNKVVHIAWWKYFRVFFGLPVYTVMLCSVGQPNPRDLKQRRI